MAYSHLPTNRTRRDVTSYSACHDLVRTTLGSPSEHECVACGSQAQEWALMPGSPRETFQDYGQHKGKRFSPDPDDYAPLDRSCHRRMDAQLRAARKAVVLEGRVAA